ncbi:MAG: NUDIX domain-containing protein [Microgenomates group bacterium]
MKDLHDELFTVVDEQDSVIGYKTRRECHNNPNIIHRAVDIVLFDTANNILLQKRSMQKDTYPGYYTVSASGHIDKGESYEQAARREMEEELGIERILPLQLIHVETYIVRLEHEAEMTALFRGVYEGSISPAHDEVESVQYVSPKNLSLLKKDITPGALAALYKLNLI